MSTVRQKIGQRQLPYLTEKLDTIRRLVTELRQNDSFPFDRDKTCGQKRYNGQFAEHYAQLERYVEAFIEAIQKKRLKKTSVSTCVTKSLQTFLKLSEEKSISFLGCNSYSRLYNDFFNECL